MAQSNAARFFVRVTLGLCVVLILLWSRAGAASQARTRVQSERTAPGLAFDLSQLRPIVEDKSIPASERASRAIGFLKAELAGPSKSGWGLAGGPLDSSYIQFAIVGAISHAACEIPDILRKRRDGAKDRRLRDRLTLAMANIGLQDTLPDVLRMAANDPNGEVRLGAFTALSYLLLPVSESDVLKRVRPGEKWKPLSTQARAQIAQVALNALRDPFVRYRGATPERSEPIFVNQNAGAGTLRMLGYEVDQTDEGWIVKEKGGAVVAIVPTGRPAPPKKDRLGIHNP